MAAVADPGTGVAVYDTYDQGGWLEVGGTSASSPIITSVYALAGTPAPGTYPSSYVYSHTGSAANGTAADLWDCNATPAQNWTYTGGTLQVNGKCLDIVGVASTANSTPVDLWDCNGGANQQWTLPA